MIPLGAFLARNPLAAIIGGTSTLIIIALSVALWIADARADEYESRLQVVTIDLAQARSNVTVLEATIEDQNRAIREQAEAAAARIAATEVKLVAARAATRKAEARVAALLTRPIPAGTLEQRVLEVDARVLESLP